jgi:hypothetical protein
MKTRNWFGGALVLSAALCLAMAGGASAQSQERGYGSGSGTYGSGQQSGYGSKKEKKLTSPSKSGSEGSMGVCTPESCPSSKAPKSSTRRTPEPETSK